MKKVFLFAAMLAIAASCTISEIESNKETTAPEITASYEKELTKTTITTNEDGVGTIWWKPADEINVFYGTLSVHYTSKNKENATTVAFWTSDIIGSTESASANIWGLYPYDEDAECDGESVTTTIPAAQQGVAGTFGDDIFTSLAHSTSTVMTFYNVLGGIKFSLSRDDIQTITFKGNNDEDIAGKVSLSMDANEKPVAEITEGEKTITLTPKEGTTFASNTNYYIVMLPTVLSNGFTMTFETETELGTFEYTTKSIEIKRSVFSKKENIDSYAVFKVIGRPLTISSIGSSSIKLTKTGSPNDISLRYRKCYGKWTEYSIGTPLKLEDGEFIQIKAKDMNEYFSKTSSNYYRFETSGTGQISVSGNIMSLLDANMENMSLKSYIFYRLFSGCKNLFDASCLELPATVLASDCYDSMFYDCSCLTSAPNLPAETLANYCYSCMFQQCSELTIAPKLPATTLAENCYNTMFAYCGNLISAPDLPATTVLYGCYSAMFYHCKKLVIAPDLPATFLAPGCYTSMFEGCSNLNYVKALFTSVPGISGGTYSWLYGVSSSGTFIKNKEATWDVTGPDGIPVGWTVLTE